MKKVGVLAVGLTIITACGTAQSANNEEAPPKRTEQPSVIELLTEMDGDKDGRLSFDEAKGPVKDNFSKIDTDGDGFLTVEELKNAPKPEKGTRPEGGRPQGGPPRN